MEIFRSFSLIFFFATGLMGNIMQALHLITDKLQNVEQAIEFCKEHNDSELWEDLIEHSIDKPSKS